MAADTPAHLARGRNAEATAEAHLRREGLDLITRNYRSPFGEIDLVMREGAVVVFVEVRFRASAAFGAPAETIDPRKRSRLRATAEHYLQRSKRDSKRPCRFDIVAITGGGADAGLEWLRNAF